MSDGAEIRRASFVAEIILRDHPCGGGGFDLDIKDLDDFLGDLYHAGARSVRVTIDWVDWGI